MHPSTLAAYLVPAMLSWVPAAEHGRSEDEIRDRYQRYAEAIAMVTMSTPDGALPFRGEHRHEMTGLLLASIASYEAHFREDVATCERGGDKDKAGVFHAWGLWQTHRPKTDVCASLEDGARIALGMVVESFKVCRGAEEGDRLALYTDGPGGIVGGSCRSNWMRSRSRIFRARAWHKAHEIASEDGL